VREATDLHIWTMPISFMLRLQAHLCCEQPIENGVMVRSLEGGRWVGQSLARWLAGERVVTFPAECGDCATNRQAYRRASHHWMMVQLA